MENWKKQRKVSVSYNPQNDPEWDDTKSEAAWEPKPVESVEELLTNRTSSVSGVEEFIRERDEYVGTIQQGNIHSLIGKECTADEVIKVWEEVSKFITLKMLEGFAVKIPGLGKSVFCSYSFNFNLISSFIHYTHFNVWSGLFSYTIRQTPKDQKFCILRRVPQFFITRYLLLTYGLTEKNTEFVTTVNIFVKHFADNSFRTCTYKLIWMHFNSNGIFRRSQQWI